MGRRNACKNAAAAAAAVSFLSLILKVLQSTMGAPPYGQNGGLETLLTNKNEDMHKYHQLRSLKVEKGRNIV